MLEWQDSDIWWPVMYICSDFWYFAIKQLPQILVITVEKHINKQINYFQKEGQVPKSEYEIHNFSPVCWRTKY